MFMKKNNNDVLAWATGLLVLVVHGFAQGALPPASPATAASPAVTLVETGRSRCAIVYPDGCRISERAARKLADYLREQTDAEVPVSSVEAFEPPPGDTTVVIVLDGTDDHRLAVGLGADVRFASNRSDAYRLKVLHRPSASPLVLALGAGPQGAKYAVYRVMRELRIERRSASLDALDVAVEPFIKTRSVALFNVWGMPIEVTRRHNAESWPADRLERYVDMYDVFGFNAIETHDRFNDNYLQALFGLTRAQWREKVLRMAATARANGQEVFLRIWGHVVLETPGLAKPLAPNETVAKKLVYLCPNDPAGRKRWEEEILDYYVGHYAGHVDHLVGHWCDPGVCRENGCTFETPMRLQMELHNAFAARDPAFQSTFSMWFFDRTRDNPAHWARRGWIGYKDDHDLINAGILDKKVGIATATSLPGSYREDIVRAIVAAGHEPAVWTWYRADHEIRPSLHVHLHERLGDYFRGLPASARELAWHGIERNVHAAANTANYYVAGRLMWEPALNVDDLLKEFLTLTFGAVNAERVLPAYLAIERIRCHSCFKNWESDRFTGAGTDDPRADGEAARLALAALAKVQIDPDYRPRVPLDVSPDQIVSDLAASLEVIRDFADCRARGFPAVEKAIREGDRQAAAKLLDGLLVKHKAWSSTLAGRQEGYILNDWIRRASRQLEVASPSQGGD